MQLGGERSRGPGKRDSSSGTLPPTNMAPVGRCLKDEFPFEVIPRLVATLVGGKVMYFVWGGVVLICVDLQGSMVWFTDVAFHSKDELQVVQERCPEQGIFFSCCSPVSESVLWGVKMCGLLYGVTCLWLCPHPGLAPEPRRPSELCAGLGKQVCLCVTESVNFFTGEQKGQEERAHVGAPHILPHKATPKFD